MPWPNNGAAPSLTDEEWAELLDAFVHVRLWRGKRILHVDVWSSIDGNWYARLIYADRDGATYLAPISDTTPESSSSHAPTR